METYRIELLNKFSHSCVILSYYSYVDVGVSMLKCLNRECNEMGTNNIDALANGIPKRTVIISEIFNDYTKIALEKDDTYKLFIFDVNLVDIEDNFTNFYSFYEFYPKIYFKKLKLVVNNDLVRATKIYELFLNSEQVQECLEFPYNIIKIWYSLLFINDKNVIYRNRGSVYLCKSTKKLIKRVKILDLDGSEFDSDFYADVKYIRFTLDFINDIDKFSYLPEVDEK